MLDLKQKHDVTLDRTKSKLNVKRGCEANSNLSSLRSRVPTGTNRTEILSNANTSLKTTNRPLYNPFNTRQLGSLPFQITLLRFLKQYKSKGSVSPISEGADDISDIKSMLLVGAKKACQ